MALSNIYSSSGEKANKIQTPLQLQTIPINFIAIIIGIYQFIWSYRYLYVITM